MYSIHRFRAGGVNPRAGALGFQNPDRSGIAGLISVLELHCAAPASVIEAEIARSGRLRCEIASRGHDGGADDLELGIVQAHLPGAVQKDSEGDATRRFRDVQTTS